MNHTSAANPSSAAAPLRVVFLAPKLGLGGMTRYLVELSAAMASRGHAIRIATVDGPGIAQHREEIERGGANVDILPALTRGAMRSVIRAHRADCIKLFTGAFPPDTRLSLRLAGTGLPMVESIHVLPSRRGISLTQRAFYAARSKARYAMVVFTEEVAAEARQRIASLSPCIHLLRYGMDIPSPGVNARDGQPIRFISISRLDEKQKDVATLVRAFALVRDRWPSARGALPRLAIVGDGPDRAALVRLTEELGLSAMVAFEGWVADPIARLRDADVFVLSTRRESPGRVNIEAAAVGLPAIASRVEGCTESVADGVNGLLTPPGDAGALAEAMLHLASDASARARLGAAGPAHAERFAIGPHADHIAGLLSAARRR